MRAVLWDLDGTFVDSEPLWSHAETTLAAEHGAAWSDADALTMVGQPLAATIRRLRERGVKLTFDRVEQELHRRMRERVEGAGVSFRPGARELFDSLSAAGIKQALVTMSYGPYMDALIPHLPEFDHVQSGDSVQRGKPAPDIYYAAMNALAVTAHNSLGIEDSAAGVGALLASGVTPVAVPALAAIPDHPRLIVLQSLEGVTAERLVDLHRRSNS